MLNRQAPFYNEVLYTDCPLPASAHDSPIPSQQALTINLDSISVGACQEVEPVVSTRYNYKLRVNVRICSHIVYKERTLIHIWLRVVYCYH